MTAKRLTRRGLATLVGGWAAALVVPRIGNAGPLDRGIGGTGLVPEDVSDRGIGGTGVVGTIRGFGSIVVNDQHIDYPDDVAVLVDGAPAAADALRVGHVVQVRAEATEAGLATDRIAVVHEVVGPIDRIGRAGLVVLGQTVDGAEAGGTHRWRRGERVAVSGLRRPDGVIVASLIEPDSGPLDRVSGIVRADSGGSLTIGRLRLAGLAAAHLGMRVILSGRSHGGHFVAAHGVTEAAVIAALAADTYSIEAYVQRSPRGLATGADYAVDGADTPATLPATAAVRAVLTAQVTAEGVVAVSGLRVAGPAGRAGGPAGGPRPGGPGGSPSGNARPGGPSGTGGRGASPNGPRGGSPPGGR